MAFQPVPPQTDLQGLIPTGRMAVAIRPYAHPTPAFGPGSVEYARRKAEELELLDGDDTQRREPTAPSTSGAHSYNTDRPYF